MMFGGINVNTGCRTYQDSTTIRGVARICEGGGGSAACLSKRSVG